MFFEDSPLFKIIFAEIVGNTVVVEYEVLGNGNIFEHRKKFEKNKYAIEYLQSIEEKMR